MRLKTPQRCACHHAVRRDFLYVVIKPGEGETETVSSQIRSLVSQK